jgi:hypothetical protein
VNDVGLTFSFLRKTPGTNRTTHVYKQRVSTAQGYAFEADKTQKIDLTKIQTKSKVPMDLQEVDTENQKMASFTVYDAYDRKFIYVTSD